MLITVAICTLNRAESLRRTLDSLAAMRLPDHLDWEVLVVDNGCADHTDAVIEAFAGRLPIRREFEPRRGHTPARNHAVDAAKGEYIVWTDDDVVVDPGWLAAYAEAFCHRPEAALFGGPVIPRYASPAPAWLTESLTVVGPMVAFRDFGAEPIPLSIAGHRIPYGPSFALRAAEHRKFRYDPAFGVGPGQQRVGEETDVIARVLQSGATGYWVPAARVEHCIGAERQTLDYVVRFFANLGDTAAFRGAKEIAGVRFWFGVPRWACRQLIEGWLGYHLHRLISPAPVWMAHLKAYAMATGAIRYWRSERR
jgi:hypothetical protein